MARTVSAEFKALWQQKSGVIDRRRLAIYRRYYNGSAFVNAATPEYLYEADFVGIGEVPWSLDSPLQNVFRTPVITLQLANERNQWVQSVAPPSFFAADATAPNGYRLFKTLAAIQVGYKLSDGTIEWVTQFTGYMIGPKMSSRAGVAAIRVASRSALLLEKSDASQVAIPFTLESCQPAVGDGVNTEFKTTSTGIGRIEEVQVNGVAVDKEDYAVANLGVPPGPNNDGKATITFDDDPGVVPGSLETVKSTGIKWYQNQEIGALLSLIAAEAGVSGLFVDIDEIIIPGSAEGTQTLDSQAEWAAALSNANVSTSATVGSIQRKWFLIDDFSDGNYTSNPVWTVHRVDGIAPAPSVASGLFLLPSVSVGSQVSTPLDRTFGTWTATLGVGKNNTLTRRNRWYFMCDSGASPANGYFIDFFDNGSANISKIVAGVETILGSFTAWTGFPGSDTSEWRVTRSTTGEMKVYNDGVLAVTTSDTEIASSSVMVFDMKNAVGTNTVDNIYWSPELDGVGAKSTAAAVITYQFNLGSTPTAMGALTRTQDLHGGAVVYKTAGAPDSGGSPGSYDSLVEITNASGQMNHTPRQWLKIQIEINPASGSFDGPIVHKLVAHFSSEDVLVSIANLEGLTCAEAFERYATLVDYETGDNPDGVRFFRPKNPTADPVVELDQENGIIEILEWDDGQDSIQNVGRVKLGNLVEEYDGEDALEASPTSEEEFGRCISEIDLTGTLLVNDLNLAAARARLIYTRGYLARTRIRAKIWLVPWMELGDKVTMTFVDSPFSLHAVGYDPILRAGQSDFSAGVPAVAFAGQIDMRVIEYKPNYDTNQSEVLMERILS